MTIKLISMNVGVRLELEVNGKERKLEWNAICPSYENPSVDDLMEHLMSFLNTELDAYVVVDGEFWRVKIAKPKKIKAPKRVSQNEFNRRIKELQP